MRTVITVLSLVSAVLISGCGAFKPADPVGPTNRTTGMTPRAPRVVEDDPTSHIRTDITQHAQELLGIKYKFGGNRPKEGFDCSGLVVYLYQYAGFDNIARTSRNQARQGRIVTAADARPGDLVFYKRPGGSVFHVSVVVLSKPEELWVIHATSSRGVYRENILASSYWKPKMYQIRSVL